MAWDFLFDSELRQRRDINALESDNALAMDSIDELRNKLDHYRRRMDRMELVCETLVRLLELKGQLTKDEFTLMLQRVDLSDGVEDNRIGPDRVAHAPRCPSCGLPVNPRRETCLYCEGSVPPDPLAAGAGSTSKQVGCVQCGEMVAEEAVYFGERGMVCEACYRP